MLVPVVPEVVLAPERLAADVARVGPLVRVRALVDQQVVGLGELAAAELADELLLGARSRCGRPRFRPGHGRCGCDWRRDGCRRCLLL